MPKIIRAISANVGVRAYYQRRLIKELKKCHKSISFWVLRSYKKEEPEIVGDASLTQSILGVFKRAMKAWFQKWDKFAEWLAPQVIDMTDKTTRQSLAQAFKEAGFSVKFDKKRNLTPTVEALIADNVRLIKSIGQQYFSDIEGIVLRGIEEGNDLDYVAKELRQRYQISARRARMIARDQIDKANQAIQRERDKSLGITEGIWVHMPGQYTSRKTHIAMNGKRFKLDGEGKGLYDPEVDKKVLPGECILCFPSGTKLHGLPFAEKLYRRWYCGKLSEIITDDGAILHVTPNHPILTVSGWKPAGILDKGDYIVKTGHNSLFLAELDANGMIPTIDKFFETLVLSGLSPSILQSTTSDFHGDGTNGNIDVIDIDSLLGRIDYAKLIQSLYNLGFSVSEVFWIAAFFSGKCKGNGFLMEPVAASNGFMRRVSERLPIFFSRLSIAEKIGFAHIAELYSAFNQNRANNSTAASKMLCNSLFTCAGLIHGFDFLFREGILERLLSSFGDFDATLPNIPAQSMIIDMQLLRKSLEQNAIGYSVTGVINNRFRDFSGHVYNLQTVSGWYIAENTIVSNCRCTYKRVIPDFDQLKLKSL